MRTILFTVTFTLIIISIGSPVGAIAAYSGSLTLNP